MPCSTAGYPLYSWDEFKLYIEAYNAMVTDPKLMAEVQNEVINYYSFLMGNMRPKTLAAVSFGNPLPVNSEGWRMGVDTYFEHDPRSNLETTLCKIGSIIALPEGAQPAYNAHLESDRRRYVGTLNSLLNSLRSNKKKIIDMGGTPNHFAQTINKVDALYKSLNSGGISTVDAREEAKKLLVTDPVLKNKEYQSYLRSF